MPPDVDQIDYRIAKRIRLIRRVAELKLKADRNLLEAQRRYRRDLDRQVCFELTSAPDDYSFVERLSLTKTAAKQLASETYSKFRPRRLVPYRIISVGPKFLKFDQYGTTNNIVINQFTRATLLGGPATASQVQQEHDVQKKNDVTPGTEDKEQSREYVVSRIMQQVEIPNKPQFVIQRYGCDDKDDTAELADNILHHSWDSYWRRVEKRQSTRGPKWETPNRRRTTVQTKHRAWQGQSHKTAQPAGRSWTLKRLCD